MTSYKERILKAIGDSDDGLTTVDVAKRAGVSKTTVIKYLSVLRSEGKVEFVEVGPSKLWRVKEMIHKTTESAEIVHPPEDEATETEVLPVMDVEFEGETLEDRTISISFKVRSDQLCAIMKRAKKCVCNLN